MTTFLEGDAGLMPAFLPDIVIRAERAADEAAIERLAAAAFGPGRHARTAFRIRERGRHDPALSFVAAVGADGTLAGSVRMTPVAIGAADAWLLGPLAVAPEWSRRGIGRALVMRAVGAADSAGGAPVLLVGDLPYYGPCGFRRVDRERVRLPGPVEPGRLLVWPGRLPEIPEGPVTPRLPR